MSEREVIMAKKSQVEDLQAKILIAEEAVKIMTDPALKSVAFQTILDSLLGKKNISSKQSENESLVEQSEPKTKPKNPTGLKGRIVTLIEDGFFRDQKTIGQVRKQLEAYGWFHKLEDLSPTLLRLVQEKALRRVKEPEKKGGKLVWKYSNW